MSEDMKDRDFASDLSLVIFVTCIGIAMIIAAARDPRSPEPAPASETVYLPAEGRP